MPQVSKIKPNPQISKRIHNILLESLLKLKNQTEVVEFITDLLTPTEQIMVAKRLSIAVLLTKGYTYGSIMDILKVSRSAITSVSNAIALSGKGYQKVVNRLLREQKIKNLLLTIEDIFDIIPPRHSDWSEWGKKKWQRKMEKQDPL
jgi:TrpR-related protein YerC/YecD